LFHVDRAAGLALDAPARDRRGRAGPARALAPRMARIGAHSPQRVRAADRAAVTVGRASRRDASTHLRPIPPLVPASRTFVTARGPVPPRQSMLARMSPRRAAPVLAGTLLTVFAASLGLGSTA